MTNQQKQFLRDTAIAATKAGHIFPRMAACEAALESNYGTSLLAVQDKNLFGTKQHRSAIYGTHVLPTREFENGEWITVTANWISYPDFASCLADRMATLTRLSPYLLHYRAALSAMDAETYVVEVSQSWSTDPGWRCSCGAMFLTEASAKAHAPGVPDHSVTRISGLGRALKVLAIYRAMDGDWDPPAVVGDVQITS